MHNPTIFSQYKSLHAYINQHKLQHSLHENQRHHQQLLAGSSSPSLSLVDLAHFSQPLPVTSTVRFTLCLQYLQLLANYSPAPLTGSPSSTDTISPPAHPLISFVLSRARFHLHRLARSLLVGTQTDIRLLQAQSAADMESVILCAQKRWEQQQRGQWSVDQDLEVELRREREKAEKEREKSKALERCKRDRERQAAQTEEKKGGGADQNGEEEEMGKLGGPPSTEESQRKKMKQSEEQQQQQRQRQGEQQPRLVVLSASGADLSHLNSAARKRARYNARKRAQRLSLHDTG